MDVSVHWVLGNQVIHHSLPFSFLPVVYSFPTGGKRAYYNNIIITDKLFLLKLFLQIIFCSQITSFSLMNCSNSFRLTGFFVPTKSTNGQLGVLSIL